MLRIRLQAPARSVLALLALGACGGEPAGPAPSDPPSTIVLIVVDTLRADHLSSYGHERATTPHIDRLAAEGLRFELAFSQAPWTTPSIASLLTSRYPTAIGIRTERSVLSEDLVLLPELLRDAGWRTGAVVSHTFCSSDWNFDQGFTDFDESNVLGHAAVTSDDVTARALELVDASGDEPLFLWAHYFDPHFAYVEHDAFAFGGASDYRGPVQSGMLFSELFKQREDLAEADVDEIRRLYDSEIAHTDRAIGALLDGLRARGRFDDALIVFTADHGEEFFDHGGLGHARQMYQELVNVPLIVKLPARGAPRTGVVSVPVPLLDVFPTVLALAGIAPPAGIEGRTLIDDRGLPAPSARPFYSETARRGGVRAVIEGRWKLIEKAREGTLELYALEPGSRDTEDLIDALPERAAELAARLSAWWEAQAAAAPAGAEREFGEAELQRLRELGYAGADEDDG